MPLHPPTLPLSPSGCRKSSWSSLPSDSSFSALSGLVGDPVEDFLPLSPEIIAIEESLPMALTALPVFWKTDTGVGLRRLALVPAEQRGSGRRAQRRRSSCPWNKGLLSAEALQRSEPSLALLSTISVSEDVRRMEWGLQPMCALTWLNKVNMRQKPFSYCASTPIKGIVYIKQLQAETAPKT